MPQRNGKHLLPLVDRGFRDVITEAVEKGGVLQQRRGARHPLSVVCPDGERLTLSTSPSDHRAVKNATAFFRRHGLEVGPKPQRPRPTPSADRADNWLRLQSEERRFTAYELGSELGVSDRRAHDHCIRPWLASGKIHLVQRTYRPGQRGQGTPVYSRMRLVMPEPVLFTEPVIQAEPTPDRDLVAVAVDRIAGVPEAVEQNGHQELAEPTPLSLKNQMWRHIADALFSLAQAAEVAARLEG